MNNTLPLTLDEFKKIYSKVTRLTVEVCIISDEGIVLTKRSIEPCIGQWHIPGGTVYFGETPEDAVHRVAMNECGVEVEIEKLVGSVAYPDMLKNGYYGWPIGLAYQVKVIGGELRGSEQGEEIAWFKNVPENTLQEQAVFLCEQLNFE